VRPALHAERTKPRTVAGTIWLLPAAITLTVALSAAAGRSGDMPACRLQRRHQLSLTGIDPGHAGPRTATVVL
jgi:ABC-2 type transport system permease protein